MKHILLVSLCLMLPIHAMDVEKKEMKKDDPHARLLAEASENQFQKVKRSRKKKIVAATLITLLTGGTVASNTFSAYTAFQPTTHRALPYTEQLPLNNATCTYQTEVATYEVGTIPLVNPFGSPEPVAGTEECFANLAPIPDKYCACTNPPCKVILETCQDKDPVKKQVVIASVAAIAAEVGLWGFAMSNIWGNN